MKYTVVRDTREKDGKGWSFASDAKCNGTVIKKLETGDYSLEGYENNICLERKGVITEWAANVIDDRFWRELERMRGIEHPYIILEFTMNDIVTYPPPHLKKYGCRVSGAFILKKTVEVMQYAQVVFAGKSGKQVAAAILYEHFLLITKK